MSPPSALPIVTSPRPCDVHLMCAIAILGKERIQQIEEEERALKEENLRLQRRLLRETERREQMTRQLSESESSIEMDEER